MGRYGSPEVMRSSRYNRILASVGRSGIEPQRQADPISGLSHDVAVLIAFHDENSGPLRILPRDGEPIDVPRDWHALVRERILPSLTLGERAALTAMQAAWRLSAMDRAEIDSTLRDLEARVSLRGIHAAFASQERPAS